MKTAPPPRASKRRPPLHPRTAGWLAVAGLCGLGACLVPVVTPNPVPPPDLLRVADCPPAAVEYRRRLEAMQPERRGAWDPARLAADFEQDCAARLAGHRRRVVLRCWRDATSAAAFLSCNDKF